MKCECSLSRTPSSSFSSNRIFQYECTWSFFIFYPLSHGGTTINRSYSFSLRKSIELWESLCSKQCICETYQNCFIIFSNKYGLIYSIRYRIIYPCKRFRIKFWKRSSSARGAFCIFLFSSTKFAHFLQRIEHIASKPNWIPIGRISKIVHPYAKGVFLYFRFFSYGFAVLM